MNYTVNDIDMMNHMVDSLVETHFNTTFSEKEISSMNDTEVCLKKFEMRTVFMRDFADALIPEINANYFHQEVTGEFFPDNFIGEKPVSNR